MTSISLSGVTKAFGATTAVEAVDLVINSGELFFLLGPSGCGKTTLLRMIAGFIEPTAGQIRFGDRDVTRLPPNRRNAGMVFQSYALWPHMTVEENVAYGLVVRKIPAAARRERVKKALQTVRMEDYAARKPNQLSGGQQQRVALARALVIEPTVLLLDEPLSNLDAKLRLEMRSEIRRICSHTRITTVYVTHDQKEALSMADRMAVLRAGRIVQAGSPRELYDRPTSRFVADFLGETNFLPAMVAGEEAGHVLLDTPAGRLRALLSTEKTPRSRSVTCSIRPEALQLRPMNLIARDAAMPNANIIAGKLARSIYLGEMAQHHVELDDGSTLRAFELNPAIVPDNSVAVRLHVNARDIVILDE